MINWTKVPKLEKKYEYDIVRLVKQVCSDPTELGDLIAKISLYLRETTNASNFSLKPEIDNPFKKGETIFSELRFTLKKGKEQ